MSKRLRDEFPASRNIKQTGSGRFVNRPKFDGWTIEMGGGIATAFPSNMPDAHMLAKLAFLDACTTQESGLIQLFHNGNRVAVFDLDQLSEIARLMAPF